MGIPFTIKETRTVTVDLPVSILSAQWHTPVSARTKLKCNSCHGNIGATQWMFAWVTDGDRKFGTRLCQSCGRKAEESISENGGSQC